MKRPRCPECGLSFLASDQLSTHIWSTHVDGELGNRERFWSKVQRASIKDCWPWTGAKTPEGYGNYRLGGVVVYAHRAAFGYWWGKIPHGRIVRHRCDNHSCCNPHHLQLGTHSDNLNDQYYRQRRKQRVNGFAHAAK